MDDFNFAPRKELSLSVDVAFKLHGTILMFYHFDKNFVMSVMGCKYDQVIFPPFKQLFYSSFTIAAKSLDFLQDLSFNIQRYATTGALLYTQSNGLGFPVSYVFSAPILISIKGSIAKTKQPGTVGRIIKLNLW